MSHVADFLKQELRNWVQHHLKPGTVVHSDRLAIFRAVQDIGYKHQPVVTGGGPQSCRAERLRWANTMLSNVKRSLAGTYHAFKSKYVSHYVAEFSYWFYRRYKLADLVSRLAYVAVLTPPLPYRLLTLAEASR